MQAESKTNGHVGGSPNFRFLEDAHIFALANLLMRPIIVIALEHISLNHLENIQKNYLRGIYLPVLMKPEECIRYPIVIAFQDRHFVPLLFAVDQEAEAKWKKMQIPNGELFDSERSVYIIELLYTYKLRKHFKNFQNILNKHKLKLFCIFRSNIFRHKCYLF